MLKFGWEVVYSPSSLISKSAAVQAPGMNHLHILVFQSGLLLTKSLMCLPKSCLMSRIPWHTGRTTRRWKRCRGSMGCPFLMSSGWLPGRSSRRKPGPGTTGRSGRCACLPSAAALLCDQGSEPGCLNADVSSPLPVFCFPDTRGLLLSSFTLLPPVSTNLFPSCISIRF